LRRAGATLELHAAQAAKSFLGSAQRDRVGIEAVVRAKGPEMPERPSRPTAHVQHDRVDGDAEALVRGRQIEAADGQRLQIVVHEWVPDDALIQRPGCKPVQGAHATAHSTTLGSRRSRGPSATAWSTPRATPVNSGATPGR